MEHIEVLIRLKLPDRVADSQSWEGLLRNLLYRHGQFLSPSLFMDEELEVMNVELKLEGTQNLKEVMNAISETGALIIEQSFSLPIFSPQPDFIIGTDDHLKICKEQTFSAMWSMLPLQRKDCLYSIVLMSRMSY